MRPKLPRAERFMPYLSAIDQARTYSNFGPLVRQLEQRLAARFGLGSETVTTVSNATMGIALALAAQGARPGTLCIIPAWTFVASAHAATMAGLIPYFVDIVEDKWALDPATTAKAIASAPGQVDAVMPVVPFGCPIDVAAWDRFRAQTGLAVVIDAAAAFDALTPSAVPSVVSLHATKVLGTGEGGFVLSTDTALVRDIRTRSNFGFHGSREAKLSATNAKLSEYHAAVGLAGLDEWAEVRGEWTRVAGLYRNALGLSNRLRFQGGVGELWIASTFVVSLADITADQAERELTLAGVETRRWWGAGAHAHAATAAFPRTSLKVTESLAATSLGLPFFRDLGRSDADRVVERLLAAR
jgi:dTDP-4-amino-4,6-dideoxygalactose transaminase